MLTALSHFKSLFVIARNSSFTYKGRMMGNATKPLPTKKRFPRSK
jgi:TolB-like protein